MNQPGTAPATLGLLCVLGTAPLGAQVCSGFPSLDETRFRVAANAAAYTYGSALGASLTAGKRIYGTIGVARIRDPELDATVLDLSLEGGAEFPHRTRQAFLCLIAAITVSLGPNEFLLADEDYNGVAGAIGVGFGGVAVRARRLTVLPAGDLRLVHLTVWRRFLAPEPTTATASDAYGLLSVGVGFVLKDVLTIRPGVTVPFGLEGPEDPNDFAVPFGREEGEVSLGISVGINFGRRPLPASITPASDRSCGLKLRRRSVRMGGSC